MDAILVGLKCMNAAHNYTTHEAYNSHTLNAFCQRHTGKRISANQWQQALDWLQKQDVIVCENELIYADPAYLQYVVQPKFEEHQIERHIFELYTTAVERVENGFYTKPAFYAKKIAAAGSFSDAERWF